MVKFESGHQKMLHVSAIKSAATSRHLYSKSVLKHPFVVALAGLATLHRGNSKPMDFNGGQRPTIVRGVIFDMDGTLTEPGSIDFAAMYSRNNLQRRHGSDILTLVNSLPTDKEREAAMQVILEEEVRGVERMMLRPHLHTLIESLCAANIRTALSTRNCLHAYDKFIERAVLPSHTFVPALHRDSLGGVNKPDPAVARHILDHWEIETGEEHTVWFVGDSMDDMLCGRHAGCRTCLITTHENAKILQSSPHLVDLVVEDLLQLRDHFVGGDSPL